MGCALLPYRASGQQGLEQKMTITIYTFGNTTISEIMQGAGECSEKDAEIINDIIGGSDPVSMSGYPADFYPCYNVFADIYVLNQQGHDFEIVEVEENEDYYPSGVEDRFVLPAAADAYRYHA